MSRFTMMLPPEWELVSPSDPETGISAAVQGMLSNRSDVDQLRAAPLLARQFRDTVEGMKSKEIGLLAMVLNSAPLDGRFSNPMIIVRKWVLPEGEDPLEALVAVASGSASAEALDIDHMVALRIVEKVGVEHSKESVEKAKELLGVAGDVQGATVEGMSDRSVSYRIRYLMGLPTRPDLWVDIFAALQVPAGDDGEALAEAYTEVCDLIVSSFRWEGAEDRG